MRTALKNEALFEYSILFKKVNFESDFKKIILIIMLDYNLLDESKLKDDLLNNNCRFALLCDKRVFYSLECEGGRLNKPILDDSPKKDG